MMLLGILNCLIKFSVTIVTYKVINTVVKKLNIKKKQFDILFF